MTRIHISLVGNDGEIHAEGMVDLIKIIDTHLIQRDSRLYYFKPRASISNHMFEECSQPYIVTEF